MEDEFLGEEEIKAKTEEAPDPKGKEGEERQGQPFGQVMVTQGYKETEDAVIDEAAHKMDPEMTGHLPVETAHLMLSESKITVEEITGEIGKGQGDNPGKIKVHSEQPGQEVYEGGINPADLDAHGRKTQQLCDSAVGMKVITEEALHASN
ncbi:MAG: hypothetical protein R6V45_04455 [Oceanipulchritudo sp.]